MNKVILAISIVFTLFAGCTNKPEEHEHEHNMESLAYTHYSGKSELFVEFKPLVVGTTSKFAAHFTILGDKFLPLSEGTVTIKLIVGGNILQQTAIEPVVPGIYRLALLPTVAGIGKLVFDITTKAFTDQNCNR
ncbi:MAG: hypothetical protein IPP71_18845 [Bacteroidetes bacterium]|nr:hypothetical protein [Bacteroidota bacterium]